MKGHSRKIWKAESQNVESIWFPSGFNFESSLYICKELLSPSSNYAKAATLVSAELKNGNMLHVHKAYPLTDHYGS